MTRTGFSIVAALAIAAAAVISGCRKEGDNIFITQGAVGESAAMAADTAAGGLADPNVQASLLQVNQEVSGGVPRANVATEGEYEIPVNAKALVTADPDASATDKNQASAAVSTEFSRLTDGRTRYAFEVTGGPFGSEKIDIDVSLAVNGFVFVRVSVQQAGSTKLNAVVFDRKRGRKSGAITFTVTSVPTAPTAFALSGGARVSATRAANGSVPATNYTVRGAQPEAANAPVTIIVKNRTGAETGTYTTFADATGQFSFADVILNAVTTSGVQTETFTYEAFYFKSVSGASVQSLSARGQVSLFIASGTAPSGASFTAFEATSNALTVSSFARTQTIELAAASGQTVVLIVRNFSAGLTQRFEETAVTISSTTKATFNVTLNDGENVLEAYAYFDDTSSIRWTSAIKTVSVTLQDAASDPNPRIQIDTIPTTIYEASTGGQLSSIAPSNVLWVTGSATPGTTVYLSFPGRIDGTKDTGSTVAGDIYVASLASGVSANVLNYSDEALLNDVNTASTRANTENGASTGTAYSFDDGTSQSTTRTVRTAISTSSLAEPSISVSSNATTGRFAIAITLDNGASSSADNNQATVTNQDNVPANHTGNHDGNSDTIFRVWAKDTSSGFQSDSPTRKVTIANATPADLASPRSSSISFAPTKGTTGVTHYGAAGTYVQYLDSAGVGVKDAANVTDTGPLEMALTAKTDDNGRGATVLVRIDTRLPGPATATAALLNTPGAGAIATNTFSGVAGSNNSTNNVSLSFFVSEGYSGVTVILVDTKGISATVAISDAIQDVHSGIVPAAVTSGSTYVVLDDIRYDDLSTNNATLIPRAP